MIKMLREEKLVCNRIPEIVQSMGTLGTTEKASEKIIRT